MMKDFDVWNDTKKTLNNREDLPTFQQQQIWWCNIGLNVGHEENGKSELFSRPVLIIRKYNKHIFLGAPLTTQIKDNPYYFQLDFKGKQQCLMLSQIKVWDCKRLATLMGKISDKEYKEVINAIKSSF